MNTSPAVPRWWDWSAVALLFVLLEVLATRLVNTAWTPFLYLTQTFTAMSFAIGIALGYSRFRRGRTRWLSFLYMAMLLPLQWTTIMEQGISLEEKLESIAGRLLFSISELLAQRPVEDPIFFVAVMSVAFWIVSASAGFSLVRHRQYLQAVLPSAVGILVIQHYDNAASGRVWMLGLFLLLAFILLGRLYYLQNRESWQARRVFLSAESHIDIASGMAILAALVVFASFLAPVSGTGVEGAMKTWNRITQPWRDFTEKLENAVSAVQSPSGGRPGEFYGTELELGRGFPLTDTVMFEVTVPDLPAKEKPPRYYWRGRAYDYYRDGQWYTTGTAREKFSPETDNLSVADAAQREPRQFIFKVIDSKFSLIYAPSQPVWVSRPGSYLAALTGIGKDIVTWNATPSLLPGESYRVQAVLNNPDIQQLREAGTDYPEWITAKYLQLPEGFSPDIAELAEEIAANAETPYDKALAVTNYLRNNIAYAPTLPAPPRNRDPLEWVLFEHRQAYCVYYASSEILMLRSLGIPARMAVGFSQGENTTRKNSITGAEEEEIIANSYTVRKNNAHAWPEVYFPGIGWVEFEPTGNQEELDRPLPFTDTSADDAATNPAGTTPEVDPLTGRDGLEQERADQNTGIDSAVRPSLYLIPLFIAFAALTFFLSRRYNLSSRVPVFLRTSFERSGTQAPNWILHWEQWMFLSPIEKAFESVNFSLRRLQQPAPIHATPFERAQLLTNILPQLAEPIKVLLDEHQTSLYTSRMADVKRAQRSALNIHLQTIVAQLRHFFTGNYAIHS